MTETATATARFLSPEAWAATRQYIDQVNTRAGKKGLAGQVTYTAVEATRSHTNPLGLKVEERGFEVTLGGQAPKFGGWTFLARLEWDTHAGLIVSTAPGVDNVNREALRPDWCDHCRSTRRRKNVFLLGHDDGRQVQVGTTCIKDFTGWAGRVVWPTEQASEYMGVGYGADPEWSTLTILTAAWASIQVRGFHPASGYGFTTKAHIGVILQPRNAADLEEAKALDPYIEASHRQAKIIRDWLMSDDFADNSEYARNLKAVAAGEFCTWRRVGLLASAPQAWAKAQERDLVRRKEAEETCNEWVGQPKQRIDITGVTIKSIRPYHGDFGTSAVYKLTDAAGHVFTWFSSSWALGETTDGTVYTLRGTVKKHDEYQGLKQTQLTRCTVLASTPAAGDN